MNLFPPAQIFIQLITIRENLLKYDKSSDMRLFRILSATPHIIRLRDYAPVQAVSERRTKTNKTPTRANFRPPISPRERSICIGRNIRTQINDFRASCQTVDTQRISENIPTGSTSPHCGKACLTIRKSLFRSAGKPLSHIHKARSAPRKSVSGNAEKAFPQVRPIRIPSP